MILPFVSSPPFGPADGGAVALGYSESPGYSLEVKSAPKLFCQGRFERGNFPASKLIRPASFGTVARAEASKWPNRAGVCRGLQNLTPFARKS